jgi:signal transduction histidine kinase
MASHRPEPRQLRLSHALAALLPLALPGIAHVNFHVAGGHAFDPLRLAPPLFVGVIIAVCMLAVDRSRVRAEQAVAELEEARERSEMLARQRQELVEQVEQQWLQADRDSEAARIALSVVHDIRNLLVTVSTAGMVLRDQGGECGELGRDLEFVVDHGRELCNRALDRRHDDGVVSFSDVHLDLPDVARAAVQLLPSRAQLRVHMHPAGLPISRAGWLQVLHNLFANSAKERPAGLQLFVLGSWTDDGYVVRVRDNGPGFPPGWSVGGGRGFGLSVVQGIVERGGGSFRVLENQSGAVVELVFPSARRPAAPEGGERPVRVVSDRSRSARAAAEGRRGPVRALHGERA